jgi:hypothetical protein
MVSGQRHTPAALYHPGKGPPVSITQEAGWVPEPVWIQARGNILSPLPEIEPRSPGRLARSQTLYCLSYPAQCEDVWESEIRGPRILDPDAHYVETDIKLHGPAAVNPGKRLASLRHGLDVA